MDNETTVRHSVWKQIRRLITEFEKHDFEIVKGEDNMVLAQILREYSDNIEVPETKPLTEEENALVWEQLSGMLGDRGNRDQIEDYTADWDDFDWRREYDETVEYMNNE